MSSGEENPQAARARPLSAGLWTLFSWLRREDYGSSDSLSSVGSDRTAVSFAFVPHTPRHHAQIAAVTPPSPSTDSYRKRVQDCSVRRINERELTLHRKYGLYQGETNTITLPLPRKELSTTKDYCERRDRRAVSEGYRRRSAHVPGKRRAPPPPSTLPKVCSRKTRKRPAPLPPGAQENSTTNRKLLMNSDPVLRDEFSISQPTTALDYKAEKYVKKNDESKDSKIRPWSDRSFLKNIFENKKRNPTTDPLPNKILPSISELDKEAAEIMKTPEYRVLQQANEKIKNKVSKEKLCTGCLRRYTDASCSYCLPENQDPSTSHITKKGSNIYTQTDKDFSVKVSTKFSNDEDKQKLKEMLKEMKNSFPKKRKQENEYQTCNEPNIKINESKRVVDAPTLRICAKHDKPLDSSTKSRNTVDEINLSTKHDFASVIISQPVVLVAPNIIDTNSGNHKDFKINNSISKQTGTKVSPENDISITSALVKDKNKDENKRILAPLTISTLLNLDDNSQHANKILIPESKELNSGINFKTNHKLSSSQNGDCLKPLSRIKESENAKLKQSIAFLKNPQQKELLVQPSTSGSTSLVSDIPYRKPSNMSSQIINQYAQRRILINQLEQSIAKGDEKAAADAAAKLAQLRLSCSVLSFSSKVADIKSTEKNKIEENIKSDSAQITSKNNNQPVNVNESDKSPKETVKDKKTTASQTNENLKNNDGQGPSTLKQEKPKDIDNNSSLIEVWVEDREGTRGPLHLKMLKKATVGHLRRQVEIELGLAAHLQKWIVGRTLCTDDTIFLESIAGPNLDVPFYLCIVESGVLLKNTIKVDAKNNTPPVTNATTDVYSELVKLEQQAYISNNEAFECGVCMDECAPAGGVILRDCVHSFCRECLIHVIRNSEEPLVSCPALGCSGILQEREIRALVSQEEYNRWLARGLRAAESGSRNAFHCRTRDCTGWALCEPGVTKLPCPVCKHTNCIPCQAIHENETCSQYRKKLEKAEVLANGHDIDESTRALLDTLLEKGEALQCPECEAIITKKWGCDWVKCSACKTEICWITRGRRWGPNGRGDISGGCRCGVEGKRCHPSCGYCH